MIFADLAGDTATACGVSVTAKEPVLALCRKLVEYGWGAEAMTVLRGGKPAMLVKSVAAAAKLSVRDNAQGRPVFAKYDARQAHDERAVCVSDGGAAMVVAEDGQDASCEAMCDAVGAT